MEAVATAEAIRNSTLVDVWGLLMDAGATKSKSDSKRAFEGNSVKIHKDGDWVVPELFALKDNQAPRFSTVGDLDGVVFKVGKRTFFKVVFPK